MGVAEGRKEGRRMGGGNELLDMNHCPSDYLSISEAYSRFNGEDALKIYEHVSQS